MSPLARYPDVRWSWPARIWLALTFLAAVGLFVYVMAGGR